MSALYGIVDLGTWTIRFSINSIQPQHARILPCVFQDRAPIRLYKGPDALITPEEIAQTLAVLKRFCSICRDYGVATKNVQIAANPHEAPNFDELVSAIRADLDLDVLRLSKQGEHWANAYGVASSIHHAQGIYIELRPSYANVYYLSLCRTETSDETLYGPAKVPFGVRLDVHSEEDADLDAFQTKLTDACLSLMDRVAGTHTVFLSASGFSGLHKLLMGFEPATSGIVLKPEMLLAAKGPSRLAQVVRSIGRALEKCGCPSPADKEVVRRVIFVHHNLRNGLIFQALPPAIRYQDPLIIATRPYALPGAPELAAKLLSALPEFCPEFIRNRLAPAAANAAYIHSSYGREVQAFSALVVAETGVLAGTHGLTNEEKVLLGLALCERWGGRLDPMAHKIRDLMVASLVDPKLAWWACYLGLALHLLGAAFPGAHVRDSALEVSTRPSTVERFTLVVKLFSGSIYSENVVMDQRIKTTGKKLAALGGVELVVEKGQ